MFKVVVSDLDGTLLSRQHQISSRTRDTLHRLVDQGVKFVVATGRHHVDVRSIRDALGLDIYHYLQRRRGTRQAGSAGLHNQALPSTVAAELIAMERDPGSIHINVYYGDEWLVEETALVAEVPSRLGFSYRLADLASHPEGQGQQGVLHRRPRQAAEDRGAPQPAIW